MTIQGYISHDQLFHFVGRKAPDNENRYEILRHILTNGVISHPPHSNDWGKQDSFQINRHGSIADEDLVVTNMVCFCDIPFSDLGIHMNKYSQFGLSIMRDHIARYGGRPVTYYPYWRNDPHNVVYGLRAIEHLEQEFQSFNDWCGKVFGPRPKSMPRQIGQPHRTFQEACEWFNNEMALRYLAYLKPFDMSLAAEHENNYYMEREWRRLGNLKFDSAHLGCVIVPAEYVERARTDLPDYEDRIVAAPVPEHE